MIFLLASVLNLQLLMKLPDMFVSTVRLVLRQSLIWQGLVLLSFFAVTPLRAGEWAIPLSGNTFRTAPDVGGDAVKRQEGLHWADVDDVLSVYFHVDRAATLELSLNGGVAEGESQITASGPLLNEAILEIKTKDSTFAIGKIASDGPQYVRVDFQGVKRSGKHFAQLKELVVKSDAADLQVDYVRNNDGNMYYWGRRGPSVHLGYQLPKGVDIQYSYSELMVPSGQDPIGTYYMANGFSQGYFGMQVNGPEERRVLFSVWSPFQTDNPRDIPEDQRVVLLSKGPKTRTGEFGNEGSGGQSYMIYPWKSGESYRFLTEVRPDKDDSTIYTCWFSPLKEDWQLVASFRRPKTNTHLTGFHSFLESFDPSRGHLDRRCSYSNVWVCDTDGKWQSCEQARFSVDATGGNRHRLDFEGGVEGGKFWLRNCGFFSGNVKAGTTLRLESKSAIPPTIDFKTLPR